MPFTQLLSPNLVINNAAGGSKKRTLEYISGLINEATTETEQESVFSGLIERERLGSTGIGEGIAIPHCRLDTIDKATAVFLKLTQPIDFDAIDRKPVDMLFALVVPTHCCDEHLETLAELASLFSESENRDLLRKCQNADDLYNQLLKLSC